MKTKFSLNEEDIESSHDRQAGHTDGDVMIHLKKADIYHMGDAMAGIGTCYSMVERRLYFGAFIKFSGKDAALWMIIPLWV